MDPGGEGGEMDKKRERAIDSGVGYDLLLITGSRDGKYIIQVRMHVWTLARKKDNTDMYRDTAKLIARQAFQ